MLRIAPKVGWTLYHESWCGNCTGWRGVGKVVGSHGDRLELELELGPEPGEQDSLDKTLYLVRWGELLFAVPEWRMPGFCADYSNGFSFPHFSFRYMGNNPDFGFEEPIRPAGFPQVPSEFTHLILDHPIDCELVGDIAWRSEKNPWWDKGKTYYAVYEVDAGARDGLAVGMRLHREEGAWPLWGVVESVSAKDATVAFCIGERREEVGDLAGSTLSTQHPLSRSP